MSEILDPISVANYLIQHPNFFDDHPELLTGMRLNSPVGARAVSLQERQMEVLREKIKMHELRMAELLRVAQDNDSITDKFHVWTRSLLQARNDVDLPHVLIEGLQSLFGVPHATLRMWGVAPEFSHTWFSEAVSQDAMLFSNGLTKPFCGLNKDFEVTTWLDEAPSVSSVALLPLRVNDNAPAFGLLVLGSPDSTRFTEDMATDFLERMGITASAALTCLLE